MKKVRWGIVGPGCIAHKFAEAVKNVDCASLTAVASRTEKNATAFAGKYDIPNVFGSYEEMASSDVIDAVYISTPHPFHKVCTELFLNAGKHVLCEKPLCVNAGQATELMQCAQRNGVFLMEAMWTRFLPAIKDICDLVQGGAIGEVLSVKADFCYFSTPEEEAKLFQNHMAGGSLLDVGVYGLHFVSLLLGNSPENILAFSHVQNGVDIHTNVLLKYKGGAIADISSAIGLSKPETAYIYGTMGYICIPHFYGANEYTLYVGGEENHVQKPYMGNGFEEEIYEACRCIKDGRLQSDILPLSDSIEIIKQMDCIREQIGVNYPF